MEIEELIYYGTKAPSGHNTQPWKFKLNENSIEIHPDFNYALPNVDPDHRELYISLGCAGENICRAARYYGYIASWSIKKNSNAYTYILINFVETELDDDIEIPRIIEERQSNRSVFNNKLIVDAQIDTLNQIRVEENVHSYFYRRGSTEFRTLKEFIKKGNEIQMNDNAFKNELVSWIRFNKKQLRKTNNGLSYKVMGAPALPKLIGKTIVRSFLKPAKQNKSDEAKIDSSSHFILLTTKNNSIDEWISLGFYLERVLLKFTEIGVANAYLNPPCEIPLLADILKYKLPIDDEHPTILMRIGYATRTFYSPRKKVKDVLLN